jgi:hypothetical protein
MNQSVQQVITALLQSTTRGADQVWRRELKEFLAANIGESDLRTLISVEWDFPKQIVVRLDIAKTILNDRKRKSLPARAILELQASRWQLTSFTSQCPVCFGEGINDERVCGFCFGDGWGVCIDDGVPEPAIEKVVEEILTALGKSGASNDSLRANLEGLIETSLTTQHLLALTSRAWCLVGPPSVLGSVARCLLEDKKSPTSHAIAEFLKSSCAWQMSAFVVQCEHCRGAGIYDGLLCDNCFGAGWGSISELART